VNQTIQPAAIRKSLTVAAPPQKAFSVFTDGFDRWWPKSHTIGTATLKTAIIEPRQGGRWYGVDENGHEDDWGEVLAWEPPDRLLLAWRINGKWTYDASLLTEIEVLFKATADGGTQVEFEHRHLERMGEGAAEARAAMDSPGGWGGILEGFKQAAES
jgi:uncharacterized protein YndB with AHSA1/START domain